MDLCVTVAAAQFDRSAVDTDPEDQPSVAEDPMLTEGDDDGALGRSEQPASNYDEDDDGDDGHIDDPLDVKPTGEDCGNASSDTPKQLLSKKQSNQTKRDPGTESRAQSQGKPEDKRVRKFVCRYCHKAFSLMNVLKVHERIHTGEKPYICEICDKAFNQSGSLNRHKNTHLKRSNDNRSYLCHYCPRQFLHSSQLQEHETTEHSAEPNPRKSIAPEHLRATADTGKVTRIGGEEKLDATGADNLINSLPQLGPRINRNPQILDNTGNQTIRPLPPASVSSAAVAGLNMLQRAFACPEALGKTMNNTIDQLTGTLDLHDTRVNGTAQTNRPVGMNNSGTTTGTLLASTNGTPFDSFTVGSMQCDLCPAKLANRMEFEHHIGQHFTQSLGFSIPPGFPSLRSMDTNSKLSSPLQIRDSGKSSGPNSNGDQIMPAISLPTKLPVQTHPAEMHYNDLTKLTGSLVDPLNTNPPLPPLSTTAEATATSLFPGCNSASALATLSKLMLNHSSPTSPSLLPQTHPVSLLAATAALANPELLFLSEPSVVSGTATNSFAQLLLKVMNSIGSVGGGQDAPNPFLILHNGMNNECGESDQGLNLAVSKDRTESLATVTTTRTTPTAQPTVRMATGIAASPVSGKQISSNGNERTPTLTPALFPLHFPWFDNMGLDMSPKTAPSNISGSGTSLAEHRILNPNNHHQQNVSPSGLSDALSQSKPTNLSVYGFEADGFSDPDGSSSTGSLPGGLMIRSNAGAEHSPNSLQSNSNRVRQCDLCQKKFNCSSALRIHYRKHSGERPYKCRHCGNAFSQNGTLKRHLQTCKAASQRDNNQHPVPVTPNDAHRSNIGMEEELERIGDQDGVSDLDSTKLDQIDGREGTLNDSRSPRSSNTSSSTPLDREARSPLKTTKAQTKRSSFSDDAVDEEPENKRSKNTFKWITQLKQSKAPNLNASVSGEETDFTGTLDQGTAQLLLSHLQSAGWLHECSDCQIYFLDREMWSEHREQMHTHTNREQPFVCAVCSQDLGDRLSFLRHFVRSHGAPPSQKTPAADSPPINPNQVPKLQHEVQTHQLCTSFAEFIGAAETETVEETSSVNGESFLLNGCIPSWSDVQESNRNSDSAVDLPSSTHYQEISSQRRDLCSITEPPSAQNIISTSS